MSLSETFGAKARRQLLGSIPVTVGLVILGALVAASVLAPRRAGNSSARSR